MEAVFLWPIESPKQFSQKRLFTRHVRSCRSNRMCDVWCFSFHDIVFPLRWRFFSCWEGGRVKFISLTPVWTQSFCEKTSFQTLVLRCFLGWEEPQSLWRRKNLGLSSSPPYPPLQLPVLGSEADRVTPTPPSLLLPFHSRNPPTLLF